jgi:hypothetical protein
MVKSSKCESAHCVDVTFDPGVGMFLIRDSKDKDGLQGIYFTREEWKAFLAGAKAGEFDKLGDED